MLSIRLDKNSLIAIVIIAVLLFIFSAYLIAEEGNKEVTLVIAALAGLFIIYLLRPLWQSKDYGANRVRRYSLWVASGVAITALTSNYWVELLARVMNEVLPEQMRIEEFSVIPAYVFILLVIYIVNRSLVNNSGSYNNLPKDEEFTDLIKKTSSIKKFETALEDIRTYIEAINYETNWHSSQYTPIDAQLEVAVRRSYHDKIRKVTDFLAAIKQSKEDLILVLGDPGSGKSVALRKITEQLLAPAKDIRFLPIYINLREWVVNKDSLEINFDDFQEFVSSRVENILQGYSFYEEYFSEFLENKRVYFILDSFDEIPALLDEQEGSDVIINPTEIITTYLQKYSYRAVLASRYFRRPTGSVINVKAKVLEIRPFTEEKIRSNLLKSGIRNKRLLKRLFVERSELVSVIRNPLMSMLLIEYISNSAHRLPENQTELFENYINQLVNQKNKSLSTPSIDEVYEFGKAVAFEAFHDKSTGFEVPISRLNEKISSDKVKKITEYLRDQRLIRINHLDGERISLVHRRFTEFFAVELMKSGDLPVKYKDIPNDGKTRDTLVLYSSIAQDKEATVIAKYCWSFLDGRESLSHLGIVNKEAVHSLRFLAEAYRSRKECLSGFNNELCSFIIENIDSSREMLSLKYAIEAIGLLPEEKIQEAIIRVTKLNIPWINDTAISACRYISSSSSELSVSVRKYLTSMKLDEYVKKSKSIVFSLKLSDSFSITAFLLKLYSAQIYINAFFCVILLIIAPLSWIISAIIGLLYRTLIFVLPGEKRITEFSSTVFNHFNFLFILVFSVLITLTGKDSPIQNDSFLILEIERELHLFIELFVKRPLLGITMLLSFFAYWVIDIVVSAIETFRWKKIYGGIGSWIGKIIFIFIGIVGMYFYKNNMKIDLPDFPNWTNNVFNIILYIASIIVGLITFVFIIGFFMGILKLLFNLLQSFFSFIFKSYRNVKRMINEEEARFSVIETREELYVMLDSIPTDFEKIAYLNFLDKNIKRIKGEYPNDDYLIANGSPVNTKLAQLEEKWQGMSR